MTPTSATGAEPRAAERGFSLVEMMVALVILGLLTGLVLVTAPDPGPRLADEAARLAARLEHAREEALMTNRTVEVAFGAAGYGFRVQRGGVWAPLEGPFERQAWPEGLTVSAQAADGRSAVRFDSTGGSEPATIRMSGRGRSVRLEVDAQGEVQIHDADG